MYPTYRLQVYDHVQARWIDSASHEASNRPHHYDVLRQNYDWLVTGAKGGSQNQAPIGYRILSNNTPVDTWDNGKVPQ